MSEVNTTFIPKNFVDFDGLDYFWEKAKAYINEQHDSQEAEIKNIQESLDSLTMGDSSVSNQINKAVTEVANNLSTHADNKIAHITADERSAWNDAKTAIDAFLKDSDMTQNAVDTLAELQAYMVADGAAAAELVNRVAVLEGIDHDAYIAYTDGKVDGKFDAIGSAAAAEVNAKAYTDAAKAEAIADADAKIASLSIVYDALGEAAKAEANAKAYAKTYTDALYDSIISVEKSVIDAIFA